MQGIINRKIISSRNCASLRKEVIDSFLAVYFLMGEMRRARLKAPASAKVSYFHATSRIVDKSYKLGRLEKEKFVEFMRVYDVWVG